MSFYDDASLVFLPSGGAGKDTKAYSIKPTNGDGDFTFSRGSNLTATRVDSNGLIEKGRENLLLQSNQFDTTWTTSSASVTSGQGGYDGSTDAWLLEATGTSSTRVQQTISTDSVQTISVYAKKGTSDYFQIRLTGASTAFAFFDLANGTLGTLSNQVDASITSVGSGWYRCSLTRVGAATSARIYVTGNNTTSVTSGDNIYIQDAQLEQGLVATEYIESGATTGKAGILEDSPRFDYSGGASCPSLLLEPSRTNIVPISEGIPEDTIQVTLTENYGTSPEGVQNSLKVQKNGVSASDRIFPIDNYNATLVSGTSYSVSAFVKNIDVDGITTIGCRLGSGGTLFRLGYQWSGSSLTKATEYSAGTRTNEILEDYGNRWWRIGFSFEADNTQGGIELDIDRDNGSATTSIETYGWQLEEGSYPTSYIPNHSGGSVTREAEENTTANISSVIGQQEGTFFLDFEFLDGATAENQNWIALESEDGQSRVLFYKSASSNNLRLLNSQDGSTFFNKSSLIAISPNTRYKVAVRYSSGDQGVAVNGSMSGNNGTSTYTRTSLLSRVKFNESNIQPSCRVHQAIVFESGLTDSELETLTS